MTKLRTIERPATGVSLWDTEVGDCWPCTGGAHDIVGRAPCWVIRLPNYSYVWHTNSQSGTGGFWDVSGEAPNFTVKPSIDCDAGADVATGEPRGWHGFITNGEMLP